MRDTPDAVMLFAAGFGTRMRPLTDAMPKPLIKVAGRPLIDHALDLARAAAPRRIVANLHYRAAQLKDHLKNTEVRLVCEEPLILDTGGGLRHALPTLGADTVWTVNTDAIWQGPNPLTFALEHWDPERMVALLVCVPPSRAVQHSGAGDFTMGADGRLSWGPGVIYGGVQIMKTEGLHSIRKEVFSLTEVWAAMAQDGKLFGATYPGSWCDVGHPSGIAAAEALLREG